MSKYKYYFKKPRSEISKDIFKWLKVAGVVCIAANSPYFVFSLQRKIKRWNKYKTKKLSSAFYDFKKKGYIKIERKNKQFYVKLTEKGREKANWLQINDLRIKESKKWDGKWRIVIFDIPESNRLCREVFRGKIKELGFYELQKSVWVYAFDCKDEINLLKHFFKLSDNEVRLIITSEIGDDTILKKKFKI